MDPLRKRDAASPPTAPTLQPVTVYRAENRRKRIEFFRREDDARMSGRGLDAGGKATLNGPKVP